MRVVLLTASLGLAVACVEPRPAEPNPPATTAETTPAPRASTEAPPEPRSAEASAGQCRATPCPKSASACSCNGRDQLVKVEFDEDHDGKVDMILGFRYDDRGNRVEAERADASGRVNERITYQYDADDNLILREIDDAGQGPDGKIDRRCRYVSHCPPPHVGCRETCGEK